MLYDLVDRAGWTYEETKGERRLKMEHIFILFAAGLWCTGYFIIGGLSLLVFNFIMKITLQSQGRTRKELVNILGEQPPLVWVLVNGVEMEIPFEQLPSLFSIINISGYLSTARANSDTMFMFANQMHIFVIS